MTRKDAQVVLFPGLFDAVMLPIVGQLCSVTPPTKPVQLTGSLQTSHVPRCLSMVKLIA